MKSNINRRDILKTASAGALFAAAGTSFSQSQIQSGDFIIKASYDGKKFVLPSLPYSYDSLEPFYDKQTLTIHHTKHHQGYVNGLNETLAKLSKARTEGNYSSIRSLSRDLAFHGSGHILHSIFWNSMTPNPTDIPDDFADQIRKDFGSQLSFKAQFAAACASVAGNGWGILAYEPLSDKLLILQAENHENLVIWGAIPLLVCDVWEHAYYLKYQNNRGSWIDNFLKIANYNFAAARLKTFKR